MSDSEGLYPADSRDWVIKYWLCFCLSLSALQSPADNVHILVQGGFSVKEAGLGEKINGISVLSRDLNGCVE